jgi:UDP-N-acetylglucosamine diphosphorylase/glucosamine-1-phosphate N-acetyltransferase
MATHFAKEILKGSSKTNPKIKGGLGLESMDLVFELPFNTGNDMVMDQRQLTVIIMAAGKGTRMKSLLPKVLHQFKNHSLLYYSLSLARSLGASSIIVVVGYQANQVTAACPPWPELGFAVQEPQLGTGHAIMTAAPQLAGREGLVLILNGDVPGLTLPTVKNMLEQHDREKNDQTVLAMELADPAAYGRLITDRQRLLAIREYRDASPEERKISLLNAGIYLFSIPPLLASLPLLTNKNAQGEYYLTDLAAIMNEQGWRVGYSLCPNPMEAAGINSREELEQLENFWQGKK